MYLRRRELGERERVTWIGRGRRRRLTLVGVKVGLAVHRRLQIVVHNLGVRPSRDALLKGAQLAGRHGDVDVAAVVAEALPDREVEVLGEDLEAVVEAGAGRGDEAEDLVASVGVALGGNNGGQDGE